MNVRCIDCNRVMHKSHRLSGSVVVNNTILCFKCAEK